MPKPEYMRPSRCGIGACPEVKQDEAYISIRRSTSPSKVVRFTYEEWEDLKQAIRNGEF